MKCHKNRVDKGIPVILGKFCASRRPEGQVHEDNLALHIESLGYYYEYVTQQALVNGLIPFYWDSGAKEGFHQAFLTVII